MIGFVGGAIGADIYCDRTGVICRTIADCAKVLDALRNPDGGTYDPRDPYTTVPRSSLLPAYAEHARAAGTPGALKGMRIGIIRELMLVRPGEKSTVAICTAAAAEIKSVLGDKLGATLVEFGRPAVGARPRPRTDGPRFPRRPGAAGAAVHARHPVPPRAGRHAAVQGIRRRDPADRVPARQGVRQRHDGADRLHGGAGGRPHRAARQSRHRHDPAAGTGQHLPLPDPAIPVAPGGRLGGARLYRDA